MFQVNLKPSNVSFDVKNDSQTILEAALEKGFVVPYGCKDGVCGSCKATLVSGKVDYGSHSRTALSKNEIQKKNILLCSAKPLSDLTIEANLISTKESNTPKKLPCRVESIEKVSNDIAVVKLKLPSNKTFEFLPGQYIDILLKDGKRRSYSMASIPNRDNLIELHIKHTPGGVFTDSLFEANKESVSAVKVKDILRLEGPLGTFFLRENSEKDIIFLASGTGIAPIKAIVESCIARSKYRNVVLYWGVRDPSDLYLDSLATEWQKLMPQLTYIPVVSEKQDTEHWKGRTGFVHQAVVKDFQSLKNMEVYACGSPLMIKAAFDDFVNFLELPKESFFSDAFLTAADK
ncbi:MAG: CDP-6-deoxy-delta-3,4-glucoseen reductase [Betaproteobacteria bacterium TMED82]|nr:MAG: CDP-6-deoxy-delta-3,4-glucoseen reductase [Betaproteobacteria bacterium TMED82]|tara:strand:- start:14914 stop:15954 length:1041 start_codon:yes stop_codon:yes gene_type:complete